MIDAPIPPTEPIDEVLRSITNINPSIDTNTISQEDGLLSVVEKETFNLAPDQLHAKPPVAPPVKHLQSSKVPSSRIGRLFHYGGALQLAL